MSEQSMQDGQGGAASGRDDDQVISGSATVPDLLRPVAWSMVVTALALTVVLTGSDSPVPWLRVLALIAGVCLLVANVVTILRHWLGKRGSELRIGPDGLQYVDRARPAASLRWQDVDTVNLRSGRIRRGGVLPWFDGPEVTALDVTLTRPAAERVHAELEPRHRGGDTYRIALGSRGQRADQAHAALTAHAPDRYDGTTRLGTVQAAELR